MRRAYVLLLICASGCAPSGMIPAPILTPRTEPAVWGGLGLGLGSAGFLGQLDATRAHRDRILRARWNLQGSDANYSGKPPQSVSELAILAGRGGICCGPRWGSIAAGAAFVSGSRGYAPAEAFTTVGLAAEVSLISGRLLHTSVSLLGNANPKMSFFALHGAILIGRVPYTATPAVRR